ncbi:MULTISPECIES: nitroreductase [unclassified Nocardioides]|uniref:nitroreductase n=1 Tax=unclassified Nocardioides TaxID=2615069 RepID=UPI000700129A|nr:MULTISPECIES: nitroreductase [unclassified Nocardioides]KRA37798.1 nitroreductase [Nocardioides sp. Root614]KRA91758.1 nitroreductase [Nocardioides sp. Root682]
MTTTATTADALEDALASRFSCRGFLPQTIEDHVLRRLFTMAQRTASWCNSQAWQVELVGGAAVTGLSERLLAHVPVAAEQPDIPGPERYEGVYQDRRRACGFELYNAVGIARDDQMGRLTQMLENFRFFGAPHVAIITSPKALGTYGVMDCGGYVATLLTAAESLGINAIAQAAIAMYADVVRAELGIPEDRSIVCAVSLGYADPDHPANTFRTSREDVGVAVSGLP